MSWLLRVQIPYRLVKCMVLVTTRTHSSLVPRPPRFLFLVYVHIEVLDPLLSYYLKGVPFIVWANWRRSLNLCVLLENCFFFPHSHPWNSTSNTADSGCVTLEKSTEMGYLTWNNAWFTHITEKYWVTHYTYHVVYQTNNGWLIRKGSYTTRETMRW